MKRTRENIDKLSLYELRNFTAIVFSVLLIAGSILSILGYAMTNIHPVSYTHLTLPTNREV